MIEYVADMVGSDEGCVRLVPVAGEELRELERQYHMVRTDKLFDALMQATPDYVLLVNHKRQIVTANRNVLNVSGATTPESLLGKRPGEAFNCIHTNDTAEGCGTGTYCSVCGGMQAVLDCLEAGTQTVRECHVTLNNDEQTAVDMVTVATPIMIDGMEFIVLVMRDISSEKRRELLERVFFHDVINTAGGIYGLACMLAEDEDMSEQVRREHRNWLVELSEKLLDEIRNQRKLLAAEKGEFVPECANVSVRTLLTEVLNLYR
ncbi:MAG TPA: PAS domain-containing protein, partial [Desulfuromonadaceae bacterium]